MFQGLLARGRLADHPVWRKALAADELAGRLVLPVIVSDAVEDRERGARYAAVLGIVAALNVPLVHFSVVWWRTLHQPPSLLKPGTPTIASAILAALLVNVLAHALLYAYFLAKRVRILRREQEASA